MSRINNRQLMIPFMVLSLLMAGFDVAHAVAPSNIISYQGRVLNANSVPVSSSSVSMVFALYSALTGGSCLWSNSSATCATTTARTVTLTSGLFSENLGDTGASTPYAAIADSVFADDASVYLEIIIAGETLSPRRLITGTPYALNAQSIDGINSTSLVRTLATENFDLSSAKFLGASALVFEGGTTDSVTTTLAFTDPTSTNKTITFPNITGTVVTTGDTGSVTATMISDGTIVNADINASAAIAYSKLSLSGSITTTDITDSTIANADVSASAAIDFSKLATLTSGNILVGSALGVPTSVAMSGDATIAAGGALTIAANSIALGTDTTGNYLATLADAGGSDFTISGSGSETAAVTIDIAADAIDGDELADSITLDAATLTFTDGTNTLATLTDAGTTGNLSISGDLTISGDDLLMGTNTSGFILVADGTNYNPVAVSGDVTISSAGAVTIAANSVALGTDTTGNYLATLADAGGSDFTISGSGSETAAVTIDLADDAIDFDEMVDTLALDAATSITGTAGETFTISRTLTNATTENGMYVTVTAQDTTSGTTAQYGLLIDNAASTEGLDGGLVLQNTDADDAVGAGVLFTAGGAGTDFTYGIDFTAASYGTAAIRLGGNTISGTTAVIDFTGFDVAATTGAMVIAGSADGIDALTLSSGDILISNGDLDLSGGDFNVTLDATDEVDISKTAQAASIEEGIAIAFTTGAGNGNDIYSALKIATTNAANHTGTGINADSVYGINIESISASDADANEFALYIGSTWDSQIRFGDASTSISIENAGVITFEDSLGNDLMTITDNGSDGNVAVTGDLEVTGGDLTTSATTFNLINATATTINFAGAATTFNIADSTATKTIDIGGVDSSAADTINISTNATAADDINIGNTHTSTDIDMRAPTLRLNQVPGTKSILIGGTSGTDGADTVTISTDSTSADAISVGNNNASTTIALTGGDDWSITAAGVATFEFAPAFSGFALCHENNGANTEDILDCETSPPADYAERYPAASDVTYGDIVVPGDRVVYTEDEFVGRREIRQAVHSSFAYQGPVLGIASNNYGDFTSAGNNVPAEENPIPIALVGRVPVNVTNEGGAIYVGDFITTSSISGKGMKATHAGRVIGMALANFEGVSGQVMVQIINTWYFGDLIGTDGTSSMMTNNVIVAPVGTATPATPLFDSYGLALRGSVWNGSSADVIQMLVKNVVTDPNNYRLSVRNNLDGEVAYITNTGTLQIAGDMVVAGKIYPSDRGVAQTSKYIYYDGSEGVAGDYMRTNAKGWSTGSYDFAEMFPSEESLAQGEVVVFSSNKIEVKRSASTKEKSFAGIVSTRPGFLAGENIEHAYPIALAGRVPTNVSAENGAIAVGDPLTASSTPGFAMKATSAGPIVGYALEPFDSSQNGQIVVFVDTGYWGGEPTSSTPGADNRASLLGSSTNESMTSLNMSGNIYMSGNEIASIGRLAGIADIWSIEMDGTMKTEALLKTVITSYQNTKVETIAVTSPEAAITLSGSAKLDQGIAEVRFEDVMPDFNDVISAIAPIRVIVTPNGPVSMYVSEKDQNHFVVKRFGGNNDDVEFDWMVTGYRKGYEPVVASSKQQAASGENQAASGSAAEPQVLTETVVSEPLQTSATSDGQAQGTAPTIATTDDTASSTSSSTTIIDLVVNPPSDQVAEPAP